MAMPEVFTNRSNKDSLVVPLIMKHYTGKLAASYHDLVDSLETDLAPVRVYTSWAKHAVCTEVSATGHSIQDKTTTRNVHHPTGLLVDYSFHASEHSIGLVTMRHHLDIEEEPAVLLLCIDGGHDFVFRSDFNKLPWLE